MIDILTRAPGLAKCCCIGFRRTWPIWWSAFLVVAAVVLVGACGEVPDLTTVTAGDEQAGPDVDGGELSDGQQPSGPEAQTEGRVPGPEQPGGEAPAGPGGGQGPGSGETGDEGPGPQEPDGPAEPVGETETGGETGGPAAAPGEIGMFWWSPESKWATVIDEIFDVCDDSEALVAVTGRRLGPGDAPTEREWDKVLKFRSSREVSCEKPGSRRYVQVTKNGPGPPGTSPQDATEQLRIGRENSPHYGEVTGPPGTLLGYYGFYYHVDEPADEVSVMAKTVTVIDGTIRGLVQNLSENMWARDVTVAAGDKKWTWPLTVQPGEVAPFEIEGWTGATDPAAINLQVTATLSTTVDVSRALILIGENDWQGTWDQYIASLFPDFAVPEPPEGEFYYTEALWQAKAPASHPSLATQVMTQTIDNLRAYVAFLELGTPGGPLTTDKVLNVVRVATYKGTTIDTPHGTEYSNRRVLQMDLLDNPTQYFALGYKSECCIRLIWVGGAN